MKENEELLFVPKAAGLLPVFPKLKLEGEAVGDVKEPKPPVVA